MKTKKAPKTDIDPSTVHSGGVKEYCHLRRRHCPSLFAFCQELKPWRHAKDDDGSWRGRTHCPECGKPVCPKCYAIALRQDPYICPSCGGPC